MNFDSVPDTDPTALSPREQEILESVQRGLTSREIADRLYISTSTVNKHIERAFWKLQVRSRLHAAAATNSVAS